MIAAGCPAGLHVSAPEELWVRTLVCGGDTVIVLCVTEDYASDRLGTAYQPIEKSEVGVALPKWMEAADVFEITCKGTGGVRWDKAGRTLNLHLGTTDLTRMIVVTSEAKLRSQLQERYNRKFAANVARLTGGK